MFEGIRDTKAGQIMKEWSEVFQPTYTDIKKWKTIKDIGKFSPATIKEMQEAWATVPKASQKQLYKIFQQLQKLVSPKLLVEILELYMASIGCKKTA
jgi:hypothetical protein